MADIKYYHVSSRYPFYAPDTTIIERIIIEPAVASGLFRKASPEKSLEGYYIYCVDGQYYEFFTKTPLVEIARDVVEWLDPKPFSVYEIGDTGITVIGQERVGWGEDSFSGMKELTPERFYKEVESFMHDDKAKLRMKRHFDYMRERNAANVAEWAEKKAEERKAKDGASRALEDWISK